MAQYRAALIRTATCGALCDASSSGMSSDVPSEEEEDEDEGPGFFDGIDDNPSEETFNAAVARSRALNAGKLLGAAGCLDDREPGEKRTAPRSGTLVGENPEEDAPVDGAMDGVNSSVGGKRAREAAHVTGNADAVDTNSKVPPAECSGDIPAQKKMEKHGPPSNFSRVDPSLPRSELEEEFPMFLDAKECLVEVKAGQMLYLPAGWFHEVRDSAHALWEI